MIGLTEREVAESRKKYGSNILTPPKRRNPLILYLRSFKDPIILLLVVAAFASLALSIFQSHEYGETIGIFCAIFLSTGIGFIFEYDANRKFEALQKINDEDPYSVMRDGVVESVKREDIVVGDLVILESGCEIPADGDLIESNSLLVNESCMTGEASVDKSADRALEDPEATYPTYRILRGTSILEGNCRYIVDRVGDETEFGKAAIQATEIIKEKTPLKRELERLARFVSIVAAVVALITFLSLTLHCYFTGGFNEELKNYGPKLLEYFMLAVAIMVVAVPEGLPMSITLSLALSMRKMQRTNNLVRKMHACETMGASTVICTDKTGTLTQNVMRVNEIYEVDLPDRELLDISMALNSTANINTHIEDPSTDMLGNPTECALLLLLHSKGIDYQRLRDDYPTEEQLPFNTENKFMATIATIRGKRYLFVKGAPEIIASMSVNISDEMRADLERHLREFQNRAMRTLGFAYKELRESGEIDIISELNNLHFMAVASISDPIREDVPIAIERCRRAGIDVKIVTGDTAGTAMEIARESGVVTKEDGDECVISGSDFKALSDEEAMKRLKKLKVICRARPEDKQRLVKLLKLSGEVVAVTGDGTNDAPALNYADVGLSMGSGTSVAKESSDITLLDDSFTSVVSAVLWGRSLYRNIQRFILFQLTINVTAMLIVVVSPFIGIEMPLSVLEVLWINLIMDTFASMALSSLPPDVSVMKEQPRRADAFIILPSMWRAIAVSASAFSLILLAMVWWMNNHYGSDVPPKVLSIFFTFFVFLQFWNLFNAKAFFTKRSAFADLRNSQGFLIALVAIVVGQVLIVEFGGSIFNTEHLELWLWILIFLVASIPLWIGEIVRKLRKDKD